MKNLFLSMFFVLFLIAHVTDAVIPCSTVEMKAAACLTFATGADASPSAKCCSGLMDLAAAAKTLDDKKSVCNCLKDGVKKVKGVQDKYLTKIPAACKITVPYPVSLSVDCNKLH